MNPQRDFEVIEEANDPNLLHVKQSFLESEGIQCTVLGENFVRAEGIMVGGPFRAQLVVRGDQLEEALRLLAEFE